MNIPGIFIVPRESGFGFLLGDLGASNAMGAKADLVGEFCTSGISFFNLWGEEAPSVETERGGIKGTELMLRFDR